MPFTPDEKPPGRIDGFVGRGFRIGDKASTGGVLVTPTSAQDWPHESLASLTPQDFPENLPPLLLLGTGPKLTRPPAALLAALATRGLAVEFMDSRAAARTYNLLLAEGREVAAALLPL